jgi:hypothetical protein
MILDENITIIILSCAKFSDLWDNNVSLLKKFWPNHPKYQIISDGEALYPFRSREHLKIFNSEPSNRLIAAIDEVTTKYVFLTFDDYFLKKSVDEKHLIQIFEFIIKNDVDYCRFFKKPKIKTKINELGLKKLPLQNVYEVNMYPGLWKVDSLKKVLVPNEDIWKTEVRLTKRARENGLFCFAYLKENIFPFEDIVRKGKYLRSGLKFIKKNDLYISDREVRTYGEDFKLFIQTLASDYLPKGIANLVKKWQRKKGKVFYSDFENSD